MLAHLALAYSFVLAHPTAFLIGALVALSLLNKLLPGHPAFKSFLRTVLDVLLACSPMPGAKSLAFAALAKKIGPNAAGAFFDWLSTWLNIPLSPSVAANGKPPLEVLSPPKGMVRLGVLVALAILTVAAAAHADANPGALKDAIAEDPGAVQPADPPPPPSPKFGGCNKTGAFCWGPQVALGLVKYDFAAKDFTLNFSPGAGYGVTFFTGKPYELGVAAFAVVSAATEKQPSAGVFSLIGSFAEYLRFGAGHQLIGGNGSNFLVFGLGANFGGP